MSNKTYEEFIKEISIYHKKNPTWRYGQAVYNLMKTYRLNQAEMLCGTDFDCFYDNTKSEAFIIKCFLE